MQRRQLLHIYGLGSSQFARRYFENRFYFLFFPLLRCFSSRTCLSRVYPPDIQVLPFGYLCLLRLYAPQHSFSQLITSFFGSCCLGILRVPLSRFTLKKLISNFFRCNSLTYYSFPIVLFNLQNNKQKEEVKILFSFLLRKEVIHPHLPVRIPCYDFTPITIHTLGTFLRS